MKLKHAVALFVLTVLGTILFSSSSASAATFTVATGNDENTDNASCALSEAIENINNAANTNTDCSPSGAYGTNDTINLPSGTITLTANLPDITESLSVVGQGKATSAIDGDGTYSGFYIENLVDTLSLTGFTFQNADGYAVAACAADVTLNQLLVDNSAYGAAFSCGGDIYTERATVTDSEFTNNESATGTAGLYISAQTDPGCSASLEITLTRVKANGNSVTETTGGVAAGILISSDNDCTSPFVETITFEDVEANGNSSSGEAGIGIWGGGEAVTTSVSFNRVSTVNNSISGSLAGIDGVPAAAGIAILNILIADLTNVTSSGNSANATSISQSGGTGITLATIGSTAELSITNTTVTDNSFTNSSNVASGLPFSGVSTLSTTDFSTFTPGTFTNILAANNTMDGTPSTCLESIDFGGGPTELPITSGGGNVIGDGTCAFALDDPTDQNNVAGLFATLAAPAYNDGFVETVALLEGSPAVDAGVAVPFSLDAQQVSRSQGAGVDAGAYESAFGAASGGGSDGAASGSDELAETGSQYVVLLLASAALLTSSAIGVGAQRKLQIRRR